MRAFQPDCRPMTSRPTESAPEAVVHLPHRALNAYYPHGDAAAREQFLRTTFDDTAGDYDRLEWILGLGSGPWYRRRSLLGAGLTPGMQVVDVGMGTGLVSKEILCITGEPANLVGVDPSPGMMAQAALPAEMKRLVGKAEAIPLPDASADFIVMGYALRHIADFAAAGREFRRVLRPGGRLLIMEITRPQGPVAQALLKAYMRGAVPMIARAVSRAPATPMLWRYYWDTIDACVAPAEVIATLQATGLQQVRRQVDLGIFSNYEAVG